MDSWDNPGNAHDSDPRYRKYTCGKSTTENVQDGRQIYPGMYRRLFRAGLGGMKMARRIADSKSPPEYFPRNIQGAERQYLPPRPQTRAPRRWLT